MRRMGAGGRIEVKVCVEYVDSPMFTGMEPSTAVIFLCFATCCMEADCSREQWLWEAGLESSAGRGGGWRWWILSGHRERGGLA